MTARIAGSLEVPKVAEEPSAIESGTPPREAHFPWFDVFGILWVIVAACLALVPTLMRGSYFGSYDVLSSYGLTTRPGVIPHGVLSSDQVTEVVPWISLAWTQVHQGHLPLWTNYEGLGMPLAFNFGSGVFSLPALVSYLTPLRVVYWVQILVSFIVGGTGAYFFGRVLRLHPIACAFAATTWVLSGAFFGYLGLPDVSVMSWAGWQFAAVLLILRGTHRLWSIVLLAVALAFSVLAGNPQIEVLILLPLAAFVVVMLLCRTRAFHGSGPLRQPVIDLLIAGIAGAGLAAPLALPGLQLAGAAIRNEATPSAALPISQVLGLFFQKFWDQSDALAGVTFNAPESWVWVGAIAVVLASLAIAIRWRRPEVIGLAAAAAVAAAASVLQPVELLLNKLPLIGGSWWSRSLIPLAFCMSILAGIGLDAVLRTSERRRAARLALGTSGAIAGVLALVWASATSVRADSFVWPAVSTAVGVAAFGTLVVVDRRSVRRSEGVRRSSWLVLGVAGSLLLCQTALLLAVDAPLPSSTSTPYPLTPGIAALQRAAGSSLVGLGNISYLTGGYGLGLRPNTNVAYGIHEFAVYDPITPSVWFAKWKPTNGTRVGVTSPFYDFAPGIPSAVVARRYGISYVLEPTGAAGPSGSVFDTRVGNEVLYRIPGAATATLVPESSSAAWPSTDVRGKAVSVDWPGSSEVRVLTNTSSAQVLRLRVASLPGWHATIDGRPLALTPYLSMMLQAHIPSGKHIIELRYWPDRFTAGLVIAACTVILFVIAAFIAGRRSRSERTAQTLVPERT